MAGTGAAFDFLASRYDELWTSAPAGRLQRDAVWRNLRDLFRPNHHILDLGCGTGEDSAWLLRQGIRVTAIDASPAMVSKARERNADARVLKIEEIDRLRGHFSGAISNFGPAHISRFASWGASVSGKRSGFQFAAGSVKQRGAGRASRRRTLSESR
jgi:SAM-dependent methyltransferase